MYVDKCIYNAFFVTHLSIYLYLSIHPFIFIYLSS